MSHHQYLLCYFWHLNTYRDESLFHALKLLAAVASFGADKLSMTADFTRLVVRASGEDILEIYGRKA